MIINVTVDRFWAMGNQGGFLVRIPDEQKIFRDETNGKTVIMGRKTYERLRHEGEDPTYKRHLIVMSADPDYYVRNATVCNTTDEALEAIRDCGKDDVFIAGGLQTYNSFLPYADAADVTYIDYAYAADTHFPDLDKDEDWKLEKETEEITYFNLCYTFRRYVRTGRHEKTD